MRKGMLYPHNVLEGFGNGAILDMRVRMANDFIKSPAFPALHAELTSIMEEEKCSAAKAVALFALDLAEAITSIAADRGWLTPLPEGGELPQALKDQAKATGSYQILQQIEAQKYAQSLQGQVIPAAPTVMDPRKH